ncbi:MAG: translation initiation factor IF-2 [Spirochaetaceae bacterium]
MAEDQEKKPEKPKATLIKHKKPAASQGADSPKKPAAAEARENNGEQNSEKKPEKKKVVVVRKKAKKPTPKVTVKKDTSGKDTSEQPTEAKEQHPPEAGKAAEQRGEQGAEKTAPGEQRPAKETETPASKTHTPASGKTEAGREERSARRETGSGERQPSRRPEPSGDRRPPSQGRGTPRSDSRGPSRPPQQGRPERPAPAGRRDDRPADRSNRSRPPQNRQRPGTAQGGGPPRHTKEAGTGASKSPTPQETELQAKKNAGKKFYKSKKKEAYTKKKEEAPEKDFQLKKKPQKMVNPVPKEIDITEVITVSELAKKMNLKASELIGKLMNMGMMVTINQQLDSETAELIASEYGCKVNVVSLYDETIIETEKDNEKDLRPRPPIVTVMGHVDHGKTKLLDSIRTTDVVTGEHGGITQHIGAYKVRVPDGEIVFLDTPGHEAFTLMRARGAQITDLVILVVAANDGVMPQTVEAINHAKEAGVPIIVAVNKIDLPEANPDRVKQQLADYNLLPEDWGGSTLFAEISALNHTGIEELLESILLQAEMLELKANYSCRAEGKVIESKVDHGRGIVSTVIVERGILRVGDAFVAGVYSGKVRAMFNDIGEKVNEAPPATPVEVLGFTGIPDAGSPFQVTENERQARQVGSKRQELEKQGEAQNVNRVTLDNLYDSIQQGEVQELKVIIKGDVHGSVEALQTALEKLSTSEIKLNVIHANAGAIIESDVHMASASNAIIVGFHVRPTPNALTLAEEEKVEIRKYNVIYEAVDDIRDAMEGMLHPDIKEEVIGTAEVRETFKVPKIGTIAGCYVTDGKVKRNSTAHVIRDGIQIHTGKLVSLKRFKDDAREVEAGYECGIGIENFNDVKVGDQFEVFETKEVAKKLK